MPAVTQIEIAGIRFDLHCSDARLEPDPGPCYRPFTDPSRTVPAEIEVELDLKVGNLPDIGGLEQVFDGVAWALYKEGAGYLIALAPRAAGAPPAWIARFDSAFARGTVFCDPILLRQEDGAPSLINPVLNRLDQLLVMYILAGREGGLLHATGAVRNGRGFVFAGRSGAGKSTLARQLEAAGNKEWTLLSDDRIVVRKENGGFRAYGTPWAGDAQIARNEHRPLKCVFFLHHGPANRTRPLGPQEAFEQLIPLVSIPWYDPVAIAKITSFCERLVQSVPCHELHFVPGPDVAGFLGAFADRLP